jgi:hypothetical protein
VYKATNNFFFHRSVGTARVAHFSADNVHIEKVEANKNFL